MITSQAPSKEDLREIRAEFPVLDQLVRGKPLAYLDNAATTQKPRCVLNAMQRYYEHDNANVHRGVHTLSQRATDAFEGARSRIRRLINAADDGEIVFTKGCTEAINLVAASWGRTNLKPGDEILLSGMEHHADIVPWQLAAQATGAIVRPIPLLANGTVDWAAYRQLLSPRTKLVGVVHVSNSLGTINAPGHRGAHGPSAEWIDQAHEVGAKVLLDGAQALAHTRVDVRSLDVDFYSMSAHKMLGPTGMGGLYAKRELLEAMPPYQGGGDMIRTVSWEGSTYNDLPAKFEAGTPNMAGAIGWAAAADYLESLGFAEIERRERAITDYALERLGSVPGLSVHGRAEHRAGAISFTMDCAHPHDIGTMLDQEGVAVRAGHHCCMPLMKTLGVPATARASFSVYTAREEIDQLVEALHRVREVFA